MESQFRGVDVDMRPEESEKIVKAHLVAHRMTTKDVWESALELRRLGRRKVGAEIKRLVRTGQIEVGWLHRGKRYFVMAATPASVAKASNEYGLLGEAAKLNHYARLLLLCNYRPGISFHPGLPGLKALNLQGYGLRSCIGLQVGTGHVVFARTDASACARPARSAQKIRTDLLRLAKKRELAILMKARRLEYIWITPTRSRAKAVLNQFHSYARVGGSPITTIIMPELIPLLLPGSEEVPLE